MAHNLHKKNSSPSTRRAVSFKYISTNQLITLAAVDSVVAAAEEPVRKAAEEPVHMAAVAVRKEPVRKAAVADHKEPVD